MIVQLRQRIAATRNLQASELLLPGLFQGAPEGRQRTRLDRFGRKNTEFNSEMVTNKEFYPGNFLKMWLLIQLGQTKPEVP
jgi:hypothetical protein